MKLTPYQKKIVDKIIDGEVYDIPSYLRVFSKGREQQYDTAVIQATFDECENGMSYLYRKEYGNTFFTDIYDQSGVRKHTLPVANQQTVYLHSNPITEAVQAELDMTIPSETVCIGDKSFSLNFLNNKYLVANSFSEIRDFVALWSYLRREALIFEGSKQVTEEDLSVFFELVDQETQPQLNPHWHQKVEIISETENDPVQKCNISMIPKKKAIHYLKQAWKLNQDELSMCKEYIDIKMMATGELKNYQQSRYRTVEEKAQSRNLLAAWIAVFISVVSVFIGNILPLFQKSDTDYLEGIRQQIGSIEQRIDADVSQQDIYHELTEIHEELIQISNLLDQNSVKDLTAIAKSFASTFEELSNYFLD